MKRYASLESDGTIILNLRGLAPQNEQDTTEVCHSLQTWRRIALSLLLLVVAGCSHSALPKDEQAPPRESPGAMLFVRNNKWTDVVIYVLHGSSRDRLGQVPSVESAVYPVPQALLAPDGQIVLHVQALGTPEIYRTAPITIVESHTVIDLTVENFIDYSTFFVSSEHGP